MSSLLLGALIAAIVGFACGYIYKAKKRGQKCIGCSCGGSCCSGCSHKAAKPE